MKLHTLSKNSREWMAMRCGYPTASEFFNLVTPAKLEPSSSIKGYVATKLAEKWLGGPIQSFGGNGVTDQGNEREADARTWYALQVPGEVLPAWDEADPKCLFIVNDSETAGASPDAILDGVERGGEIKSPEPDTLVEWLIAGRVLPVKHRLQVHGSMLVAGWNEWDFIGHHPRLPKLYLTIKRDHEVCDAIQRGLDAYWKEFNKGWARLLDINGGPPKRDWDEKYEDNGTVTRTIKPDWDNPVFTAEQLAEFNKGI